MEREQRDSSGEAISGQKVCRNYATVFRGSVSDVCGPAFLAAYCHLHLCGGGSRDARSLWHALARVSWIIPGSSQAGVYLPRSHCPVVPDGGVGVLSRVVRGARPLQIRKRLELLPGPQGLGGKGARGGRSRSLAERSAGSLRRPPLRGVVRKVAQRGYRRHRIDPSYGASSAVRKGYFSSSGMRLIACGLY